MLKPFRLFGLLVGCGWLAACAPSDVLEGEKDSAVRFSGHILRAAENGTNSPISDGATVRFFLYQAGSLRDLGTATYVYHEGEKYLEAVGDGLNGTVGPHSLAAVSPALSVAEVDGRWALITCPNRITAAGDDDGAVYATSMLETFDMGEYADIRFSQPLKDIRSKIGFEISSSPDEPLSDIELAVTGAGQGTANEKLYYYPSTRQCGVPAGVVDSMFYSPKPAVSEGGQTLWVSDVRYLLAGIYAPKNVTAELLGLLPNNELILDKSYLSMRMGFRQGSRKVSTDLMLNTATGLAELLPYHMYIFHLEVSTSYIEIQLTIYKTADEQEWQSPTGDQGITIGSPEQVVKLGRVAINGWNGTGDLSQTIGGE